MRDQGLSMSVDDMSQQSEKFLFWQSRKFLLV